MIFDYEPHTQTIWHLQTGMGIRVIDTSSYKPTTEKEAVIMACCIDDKTLAFHAFKNVQDPSMIKAAIIWYLKNNGHTNVTIEVYSGD